MRKMWPVQQAQERVRDDENENESECSVVWCGCGCGERRSLELDDHVVLADRVAHLEVDLLHLHACPSRHSRAHVRARAIHVPARIGILYE